MRLFQHSQGFIVSFGFDVSTGKPDLRRICWNDPETGEWAATPTNQAGWLQVPYDLATEFVFEHDGQIVAYQSGRCIEMQYLGLPLVWGVRHMTAHNSIIHIAA